MPAHVISQAFRVGKIERRDLGQGFVVCVSVERLSSPRRCEVSSTVAVIYYLLDYKLKAQLQYLASAADGSLRILAT